MAKSTERRSRRGRTQDDGSGRDVERDEAERPDTDAAEDSDEQAAGDGGEARLSAKELTEAAVEAVTDLAGLEVETVTGLGWDGEAWVVTVDVLEVARIPNTTDVLATYEVKLDDAGSLLGYQRTGRFLRSQVEGD